MGWESSDVVRFDLGPLLQGRMRIPKLTSRAATILRSLGNEAIQFSTQVKKNEPGIQKQLNTDVKSTTKLIFSIYIFIYFPNIMCFRFSYFKHLQTLTVCLAMFL